ncbi:undecaprenyldiphospho-muramoylpentapeptide beta-N-acetylglucosaminyltransferase [Bombella saccharophila]|uniref:UDP-N-acetylglucosamine--N-acetylmuramyl-(pentapeptide) pyrophosphoryl-undecaprenol N-acetylglucosamine transferase n=1 Tax=Bombella saccharophila TaxID=2967338 RepID=A0ABT3W5M3_9PROT|nr:undecaprenyldiphospho-muramoylpentapeptide beta-N-acetylglucosaminyltransferase [Bombella saccharophila]MCX5614360.1 undecaprenyldiphospho-muramoylpentapeptide beta-N-acetylglucosaminyltransferase [Bombella saccharophila]PHI95425.1 undecaprenyldiphospho-muramoylpentapeptide beta-N-acetylglucosaminyltransferase [Parasaccharibacter apium]
MTNAPIIIAAGGTGGHFFPAEALGEELQRRGYPLILMTDPRHNRAEQGVFAHYPRYTLASSGVAGKKPLDKFKAITRLLWSCLKARKLIAVHHPTAIIGFGGYPSIPPLLGSRLLCRNRPALIIHEGNAILGQANAVLSRFANAIATSYPQVMRLPIGKKVVQTGMPVRPALEALADEPYSPPTLHTNEEPIHLLIWGGSLGAQVFSTVVPQALCNLPQHIRIRLHVTQQAHEDMVPVLTNLYKQVGITAHVTPFINDVASELKQAHLVIGRAGGSSVAELAIAGRPSIMVPLPIAASDEQGFNAQAMERAGGGWMIRQRDFQSEKLCDMLLHLFEHPDELSRAAHAARTLQQRHAAKKLADLVEATLKS